MEILAEGFDWSEGPVWVGEDQDGYILFSDVPRNTIYRWREGQPATIFLKPAGYTGTEGRGGGLGANGLGIDQQGRLVLCQHGDRRIAYLAAPLRRPQSSFVTLADRYNAKRLNSPNDLTFHRNGDIYFTDPPYGLVKRSDDLQRDLDYAGVFRLDTQGQVTLLTKSIASPNGIAFSPDFKTLYIGQSDSKAALWHAFDLQDDGTLGDGRIFFDATKFVSDRPGVPDGMKADEAGNVYATGLGGVLILDSTGKHVGTLLTGCPTGNCCFGNDGRNLYIAADTYLLRIRLKTRGMGFGKNRIEHDQMP